MVNGYCLAATVRWLPSVAKEAKTKWKERKRKREREREIVENKRRVYRKENDKEQRGKYFFSLYIKE